MLILVINSGSSSIKYQLFDMRKDLLLCKGVVERIGQRGCELSHQISGKEPFLIKAKTKNHQVAIQIAMDALTSSEHGAIKSIQEIVAIGHRVVHGGEEFKESTLINERVIERIEHFSELAPLHNPPALLGIKACKKLLPNLPQVAVFDTAFHQTMPDYAYLYALPYELYQKYGIRRYGFHGTSHKYVAIQASKILNRPLEQLKLITCHLGNGCSITAIEHGKSIDTSMGFTPLEGLVMGTRSGDIDPAIVFYLMKKEKLSADKISDLLNKESGLLGMSGISNDMRDIFKAVESGDARAQTAIDVFVHRIKKYIGAYIAVMNGVDAIVFTAGIGENQPRIRQRVCRELSSLINESKSKVFVIPTNEELMIAQDTERIAKGKR